MILNEIMEKNRNFVAGDPVPAGVGKGILILTCLDPRLVDFLERSLGIGRGDAAIIKNSGAFVTDDVLRSMAMVLFHHDIQEIFVIGHTDCQSAKVKIYEFTEAMRKKGVGREAITSGDLRGWLGAAVTERERVRESVETLRKSPLIPKDIPLHGLLLDISSGALEVIVQNVLATKEIAAASKQGFLEKPVEWAHEKIQEAKDEVRKVTSALEGSAQWAKDTASDARAAARQAGGQVNQAVKTVQAKVATFDQTLKEGKDIKKADLDWSTASDNQFLSHMEAFNSEVKDEDRTKGWYEKGIDSAAQSLSQAGSSFPTKKVGESLQKADRIIADAGAAMERFEVWIEDLGVFGDDVKKEIRRITGKAVDDASLLRKAIMATQSPQDAQKVKKQLQVLGASALIRRVKKTMQ